MLRIFFFLLVLSCSVNSPAQGIVIENQGSEERALYEPEDYESVFYQASGQYRLQDTNLYFQKGIRQLELFDAANKLVFKVIFDRQGNVVHLASVGRQRSVMISTDVFPAARQQLTVVRYYNNDELLRIDTSRLEHITRYRRKTQPIRYDQETYWSYKRGRYLAERNDYYKRLLADRAMLHLVIFSPVYISPAQAKRIDGNADRPFRWPETDGSRLLLRRGADPDKFYRTQEKKVYRNVSGASSAEQERILKRSSIQYFKEGENYACCGIFLTAFRPSNWCGYAQQYVHFGPSSLPPYIKEVKNLNRQGLIDSIVQIAYAQQAYNKPCVRPLDTAYTLYLNGYAGRPDQIRTLYTFRYTYFTD